MKFKELLYLLSGCFIVACAYNIFFLPNNIVCFGISGLSIVMKEFGLEPSIFILIVNIILLGISLCFIGKEKTINSIIGSLIFPVFVYLTKDLSMYFPTNNIEMIVNVVFGAILAGVGYGFVFKTGYTTGGTDIIGEIANKYLKISLGKSKFISDGIIVLSALLVFAWEKVLYGFIILYVVGIVIDKIILGISNSKVFYVITKKEKEIKNVLIDMPECGITTIKAKGGYENDNETILLAVVPTRSYTRVKEKLKSIDCDIFFLVCDTYEVNRKNREVLLNKDIFKY